MVTINVLYSSLSKKQRNKNKQSRKT